jgi:hypothetical protein
MLAVLCPLHDQAQPPAAGSVHTVQAQPGSNTTGSVNIDQKLSGLAVVIKVDSIAGDPLFYADGYRIRVNSRTVTAFSGDLKDVADVVPGTWIHFVGVRDNTGVLVAGKARFFPPGSRRLLTAMGPRTLKHSPDYQPVTHDSLLDANGRLVGPDTKVRLSDAGGPCGWHRVPADLPLQERVERIGMRLVPAFQKQLPFDDPARIPFRFYAIADDRVRSSFACNVGLVLVPKNVVERLQSDDQLASVLAEGIAFHLQRQLVTLSPLDYVPGATEVARFIPALFPVAYIAGDAVADVVSHELEARLKGEFARMALQLADDAGFDPWQAPEAWRLLSPKEPPRDIRSIKYTPEGNYQLRILNLQYKRESSAPSV